MLVPVLPIQTALDPFVVRNLGARSAVRVRPRAEQGLPALSVELVEGGVPPTDKSSQLLQQMWWERNGVFEDGDLRGECGHSRDVALL